MSLYPHAFIHLLRTTYFLLFIDLYFISSFFLVSTSQLDSQLHHTAFSDHSSMSILLQTFIHLLRRTTDFFSFFFIVLYYISSYFWFQHGNKIYKKTSKLNQAFQNNFYVHNYFIKLLIIILYVLKITTSRIIHYPILI